VNIKNNWNDLYGITWGYLGTTLYGSWRGGTFIRIYDRKRTNGQRSRIKENNGYSKFLKHEYIKKKKCNNITIMWWNKKTKLKGEINFEYVFT
jgi:hypothetical protein